MRTLLTIQLFVDDTHPIEVENVAVRAVDNLREAFVVDGEHRSTLQTLVVRGEPFDYIHPDDPLSTPQRVNNPFALGWPIPEVENQ